MTSMVNALPANAINALFGIDWEGGVLITVSSEIARPNSADITTKNHSMKPVVKFSPDRVPQHALALTPSPFLAVVLKIIYESSGLKKNGSRG